MWSCSVALPRKNSIGRLCKWVIMLTACNSVFFSDVTGGAITVAAVGEPSDTAAKVGFAGRGVRTERGWLGGRGYRSGKMRDICEIVVVNHKSTNTYQGDIPDRHSTGRSKGRSPQAQNPTMAP